jgi:hypothetical protein
MNIESYIVSKEASDSELPKLLTDFLNINEKLANFLFTKSLLPHISQFQDDAFFFIETPYVDKVYRDSYYTYFSSKLGNYRKDCMRISIFNGEINIEDFQDKESFKQLNEKYCGFFILRPTISNLIGRSIYSPKILKENNFITCKANFPTSVNFVKFQINGFPHSSQDAETISCAETTIWAIMEYFGYKYAEYKPVLPSKIIEVLRRVSTERQIPSKGLNIPQMAYALREFGFGTKVYSRIDFGNDEFKRLYSCYVESGIPVVVALENRPHGTIGHAILGIGHSNVSNDLIDNLPETTGSKEISLGLNKSKNLALFDNDDVDKEFVFNDDNQPAYQRSKFDTPSIHYSNPDWHNCKITAFVVPLYPKIYLDAYEAKLLFKQVLFNYFDIPDNSEIYIRFFLTSSRSFKNHLNFNETFNNEVKELILEKPMPKFIWIGEISTKELIKNKLANGLVIIDATEANTLYLKPLIMATYLNHLISIDSSTHLLTKKIISLSNFSIFTNNLKN